MGRLRTKGRHDNQYDLIEWVLEDYHKTRANLSTIAQINRISLPTVSAIVSGDRFVVGVSKYGNERRFTFFWCDEEQQAMTYCEDVKRSLEWCRRHYEVK